VSAAGALILDLVSEPATPDPDKLVIWASALDGLIYTKDENGIVEAIGVGGGSGGSREVLTSNKTVWVKSNKTYAEVDQTGGNDTTGDGTETTPWLTIEKLSNYIATVDLNGFTLTCNLNGSFGTENVGFTWKMPIGSGALIIRDSGGNKNNTKLKGVFTVQSASTPIEFEEVTFQESISNSSQLQVPRNCSVILNNCRVRSKYYVLRTNGGVLTIKNTLTFRNYATGGNTNLFCLFYGTFNGQIDISTATIKTVTDDSDTVGSLTFTNGLCHLETHALLYAGGATIEGSSYSVNTTDWHRNSRNPDWSYS
jgi:hypothetical protein